VFFDPTFAVRRQPRLIGREMDFERRCGRRWRLSNTCPNPLSVVVIAACSQSFWILFG
jgi:hypothetical protein